MRPPKKINPGSGGKGFTKGRWTAPPVVDEGDDTDDIEVVIDDTTDDETVAHRTVPGVAPTFSKWDMRPTVGPIVTDDDTDDEET